MDSKKLAAIEPTVSPILLEQTDIPNLGQVTPSLFPVETSKLFETVNSILKTETNKWLGLG